MSADRPVVVPVAVVELDEAHAALRQPPGQETVGGEGAVHAPRRTSSRISRAPRRSMQPRHGRLHPERHLVLADARLDSGSSSSRGSSRFSFCDGVNDVPLLRRSRPPRGSDVQHRVALDRNWTPWNRLGGNRCATASPRSAGSDRSARGERTTKPGQVLRLRAEPVAEPGSHARPAGDRVPVFMKVCAGSWLICSVCIERTMQISSAMLPMWGRARDLCAGFPYFSKGCCGPKHLRGWPWSWAIGWPFVNDSGIGLPSISASFGL